MKTIDRYIIRSFVINYLLLFAALNLLIITLDLIFNIDEFARLGEKLTNAGALEKAMAIGWAILDFYGPQVAMFYIYAAGVLPIAAAGFTLSALIRNRELTALLAGGVSLYRVAAPILFVGCLLSTGLLIDYELIVPTLRDKLARSHKDVKYQGLQPFRIEFVPDKADLNGDGVLDRDLLFAAMEYDAKSATMTGVTILKRNANKVAAEKITATQAQWDDKRQGWSLIDGYTMPLQTQPTDGGVILIPTDPVSADFVPSGLDPTMVILHRYSRLRSLLSLRELDRLEERGTDMIEPGELQQLRHGRFSMMVTNVLILAMGLPFFLVRGPINMLNAAIKAAPLCLGAWASSHIMMQGGGLGLGPVMAAWLPPVMYLPAAFYMLDRVET